MQLFMKRRMKYLFYLDVGSGRSVVCPLSNNQCWTDEVGKDLIVNCEQSAVPRSLLQTFGLEHT